MNDYILNLVFGCIFKKTLNINLVFPCIVKMIPRFIYRYAMLSKGRTELESEAGKLPSEKPGGDRTLGAPCT